MKKKNKIIAVISSFVLIASILLTQGTSIKVQAATIGQQLTAPESGWRRYDDRDTNIIYNGDKAEYSLRNDYNNTESEIGMGSIEFAFNGTKLRVISDLSSNRTDRATIYIDGNSSYVMNLYSSSQNGGVLTGEITGLNNGTHIVKIENTTTKVLTLDAIDIDSTGELQPLVLATGISLDKTSLDKNVGDTDNITATVVPNNATNRAVKWTSSNPDVVSVDENTGAITARGEGSAIITATTQDGTNLSASCTVNVKKPDTGNGLLTITMTDGQQRSYDLKKSEIDAFIAWYNAKASGTGPAIYSFNKAPSSAAYTKRTEYIIFDKISNFDVDEYNVTK